MMQTARPIGLSLVLVIVLLLAACGAAGVPAEEAAPAMEESAAQEAPALESDGAVEDVALTEGASGGEAAPAEPQQQNQNTQRLIIRNAELRLEVADVAEAEASITTQATRLDGYVVQVETHGTDANMRTTVTFRVPAERFDEALSGVEGLAVAVLSRSVSGDDVTEEFVDLESRLRNLEATRDRMLDLLDRAEDVEAALEVNRSLSEVQGQIEHIQGRMQYLERSAALSTITATLYPEATAPIVAEGSWQPVAVAMGALRALVEVAQAIANLLIVLLVWTPVWLPPVLLARWLWQRRNRVEGKAKTPAPTGEPPASA